MPYNTTGSHRKQGHPAAVIFDMDGTLVATTDADFMAWQKLFREYGKDLSFKDYFPLLGRKSQDVVNDVLELQGEIATAAMARKMELFEEIVSIHGIHVMPNVEAFLKRIADAGIPMALATSSRKLKMQLVMEGSGLDKYFSVFVTGEEVSMGKPNPHIFLLAAEKLGVEPKGCIVLEDAFSGVAAAKAAGMKCIAIISTHEEKDLYEADLIIENFSQLSLEILDECMRK
jgi:beta-phosphoglucomutase family hydrolase